MTLKRKRYPGVQGKTVRYIDTNQEEGFIYVHIRFTDETGLSISFTSGVLLYCATLYEASTGNYEVLREYVRPGRLR